jgi:uncharacterized protein DUF4440
MSRPTSAASGAIQSTEGLLRVAREFGEAWATRDFATLEGFLADEYIHTDIDGNFMPRAAWLAQTKNQTGGIHISFRDLNAAIYGEVGVITGANDIGEGANPIGTIRFTQVWVWRNRKWQRVAFHATRA